MENNLKEQKFWTVQLLPLRQEDKKNISMCIELQEDVCRKGKIFGMGWTDDNNNFLREIFSELPALDYSDENNNNEISKEKAEEIIEKANKSIEDINKGIREFNKSQKNKKDMKKELNKINKVEENIDVLDLYEKVYDDMFGGNYGLSTAIKHYKNIRKDDLVIARLKNGKYCIGRVKNNKIVCMGTNNDNEYSENAKTQDNIFKRNKVCSTGFSWCMSVYEWYIIEEYDIPGHISGRFSGRSAWRAICPVRDTHMQQLMKIIYYKCEQKDKKFNKNERLKYAEEETKPIQLKIDNIATSLSPYELEDLVFLYIMDKHKGEGYKLLPSKCKTDEVRYECYIINENNTKEVIAFQVKNQEEIECSNYVDEDMKKIYLYSGVGYKWRGKDLPKDTKKIEEEIKEKSKTDNIEIISDKQLFDIYIKSEFFKYQLEMGYYTL